MKNIWPRKRHQLSLRKKKIMEMLLEDEIEQAEIPTTPAGAISKADAKTLIKATKGKFFTVTFTKKDGTTRVMNARLGVKAYLKGGELPYDPEPKGLIPVYDMGKQEYRMINTNTITNIKIGNKEFKVQ
jgi:hypothetical protein